MKKIFLILLTVLTFAMLGAIAYADDLTTDASTSQSDKIAVTTDSQTYSTSQSDTVAVTPPTTAKIDKNDPLYISIQQKNAQRKKLITDESQVIESIKAQNSANSTLRKTLILDAKAANKDTIEKLESQIKDARTQSSALLSQRKDLLSQRSDAVKAKNTALAASLKTQIDAINEKIKAQKDIITGLKTSLTNAKAANKAVYNKIDAASSQIREVNIQILNLDSSIESLRASKESEWYAFEASLKSMNLTDANTHLDNVINYKQQIIDKYTQVLALKKQIETILNSIS